MWRKTIAARGARGGAKSRVVAGRILTGRWAFLVAGLLDLAAVIWWLTTRRRPGRSFDPR
jgi:hypothetical protein